MKNDMPWLNKHIQIIDGVLKRPDHEGTLRNNRSNVTTLCALLLLALRPQKQSIIRSRAFGEQGDGVEKRGEETEQSYD